MVTNYPVSAARTADTVDQEAGEPLGFVGQAMLKVRQSLCGLHGHDSLLHFGQDRMFLRCTSCGHETPGWEIGGDRPQVRFREQPHPVAMPRLVGMRKIA
jgi:hypothetical protein